MENQEPTIPEVREKINQSIEEAESDSIAGDFCQEEIQKELDAITKFLLKPISQGSLMEEIKDTAFWHARAVHCRGCIREQKIPLTSAFEKMKAHQYGVQKDKLTHSGGRVTEAAIEKAILLSQTYESRLKEIDTLKALDQTATGLVDTCLIRHSSLKHMSEYMIAEKTWGEHG